jgi:hypothetical protein
MREEEYKDSAWLGWPVEWLDGPATNTGYRPGVPNPHVTCLYFPNVVNLRKQTLMDILKEAQFPRRYRVVDTGDPAAFGPEKDIPVLLLKADWYTDFMSVHRKLSDVLRDSDFKYAVNFQYNPHLTVDLPTMLRPPEQILIRPLELWWRDDDPVPV